MIKKDSVVSISFIMKNSRGEVLETNSITYLHGSENISPILQAQLEGLEQGQTREIYLKKGQEDADEDFTFIVTINAIRNKSEASPVKIHLLSGFLGSGKTTAIREACRLLIKQDIPVAVITNDQGAHLVDSHLFTHLGIPSGEVTNGCFCCNYNDLDTTIRYHTAHTFPGVIFAESVGSCTDLVATVLKPLLRQHPEYNTTFTVFADAQILNDGFDFDDTVNYIYNKQLEEAKLIVVSKCDLVDTAHLQARLRSRFPEKTILFQNSFNEEHISHWLQTLETLTFEDLPSLNIDYDTYGEGEAKLAWLDRQLEIRSPGKTAQHAALALIKKIARTKHPIGHLKFLLDGNTRISITATSADAHPKPKLANTASLLINARVQTDPETLAEAANAAIAETEKQFSCTIRTITHSSFQPGYPRPTHRMA